MLNVHNMKALAHLTAHFSWKTVGLDILNLSALRREFKKRFPNDYSQSAVNSSAEMSSKRHSRLIGVW